MFSQLRLIENIQETILIEGEKFYNSVQEARGLIDTDFRVLNDNEAYRLVSHLEPNVEDEYKVDLDQFLSFKHKAMLDRVKIDSDEELTELTQQYIKFRDEEKVAKVRQTISNATDKTNSITSWGTRS